jgi:hypothetical protein
VYWRVAPGVAKYSQLSAKHPDRLHRPHNPLFNRGRDAFIRVKVADNYLHVLPRFRTKGAVHPLSHKPSWCAKELHLYLYFYKYVRWTRLLKRCSGTAKHFWAQFETSLKNILFISTSKFKFINLSFTPHLSFYYAIWSWQESNPTPGAERVSLAALCNSTHSFPTKCLANSNSLIFKWFSDGRSNYIENSSISRTYVPRNTYPSNEREINECKQGTQSLSQLSGQNKINCVHIYMSDHI